MNKFLALAQFLLALSGCALGDTSFSHRVVTDGHEALSSKAHVRDGVARFECRASDSGWCHYTLYPEACGNAADCALAPLQQFRVARGDSHQVAGLAAFRLCVDARGQPLGPDCQHRPAPLAR